MVLKLFDQPVAPLLLLYSCEMLGFHEAPAVDSALEVL